MSSVVAIRRPRLMIADDDPLVGSLLGTLLNGEFELVGMASDSLAAVELARTSRPHAALVDVEMPEGGGLSAVRGILEVAPDTAIVMLSVDESDGIVRQLMQAGAMAYHRKGVAPQVLATSLIDAIRAHAAERVGLPA